MDYKYLIGGALCVVAATGIAAISYYIKIKLKRRRLRAAYPKNKVILHQFPRGLRAPSASPFVMKLETWLRFTGIPYQNEYGYYFSKKGQIPWITYNNEDIADSQTCIEFLSKKFDIDLNKNLTTEQLGVCRAFAKMTEESLKWQVVMRRYLFNRDSSEAGVPKLMAWVLKGKVHQAAWLQGYGRHSEQEVYQIGKQDIKAINDYIGNKKYFMGNEICDADASLFGMLCQFIYHDNGPINAFIKNECHNIVRYVNTIKETYWSDWDNCIRKKQK